MRARQSVHFEALLTKQRDVLTASAGPARIWGAYLAGGLALALHLGHRVSADFDWFTPNTIPPDRLLDDIEATGLPVAVRQNDEGTFLGQVDGLEYSVFRYQMVPKVTAATKGTNQLPPAERVV